MNTTNLQILILLPLKSVSIYIYNSLTTYIIHCHILSNCSCNAFPQLAVVHDPLPDGIKLCSNKIKPFLEKLL